MDPLLERLEVEPAVLRDHQLAVERAARGQLGEQRCAQLGEVAVERLRVAALEQQLLAVAEHEHAKAVPLRLEDPVRSLGQRGDALREHRQDRRVDGKLHKRILQRVPHRVFLLSPASCAGKRCDQLLARGASFELAQRLRDGGVPLGEVFSFVSSLYFRGKLTYARHFAAPPARAPGVLVITAGRGLVDPDTTITARDLRAFRRVSIDAGEPRYAAPLKSDAEALRARIGDAAEVVLLGSIATAKYVDVLGAVFGRALRFPGDFVGRGDMSRGGLLLRATTARAELAYQPIDGAERRGRRAVKLEVLARARTAG